MALHPCPECQKDVSDKQLELAREGIRRRPANPFADACIRTFVPRDARFEATWPRPDADVGAIKDLQLVTVAGSVVTGARGESILLADSVTVEAP